MSGITVEIVPRDKNVTIRKNKNNEKRPREKKTFSVITNERETKDFIQLCKEGKVSPKLHLLDKEEYITTHPQRVKLGWLRRDKSTMFEVEFRKDGKDTGIMTGK